MHAHGIPGSPDRRRHQRLVLYQFALKDGKLDRLLVREHLDIAALEAPARRYVLVTRVHFVSTGEWTVSHGGKRRGTNYHHGSRGQNYAYDLVVQEGGRQRSGAANRDYYCYGLPVLAPAAGTVLEAINNIPDNAPGTKGRAGGNGVVIDHGFGEQSSLWHMIPGSVTVKAGDKVELGQVLGKVGNSGRSSGPHIHFQMASQPEPHGRGQNRSAGAVRRRVRRRGLVSAQDAGPRRAGPAQQAVRRRFSAAECSRAGGPSHKCR